MRGGQKWCPHPIHTMPMITKEIGVVTITLLHSIVQVHV